MFELPKILVTGAEGQLGYELVATAQDQGFDVVGCCHQTLDISDPAAVQEALQAHQPAYIINAAGCSKNLLTPGPRDFAVNRTGPGILAAACRELDIALIQLSCASVFDGAADEPYTEEYQPNPQTQYGLSLYDGEQQVRAMLPRHVILRTGWLFSARGDSVVRQLLEQARTERSIQVADHIIGAPTSAADLSRVIMALIKQFDCGVDSWGTYHYCATETVTWFGFCEAVIAAARQYEDLALETLETLSPAEFSEADYPAYSVLDCSRILRDFGVHQRTWRTGLVKVIRTLHNWSE